MTTEYVHEQPGQHPASQFVEKHFLGNTPEEKVAEVYSFAQQLRLKPQQALVRIFNSGLIAVMKAYGTDRAGIDEIDTRHHFDGYDFEEEIGYAAKLRALGLRRDDGLYAVPLIDWAPTYSNDLFVGQTLVPAHRSAVAIYDGDLLLDISDDQPSTIRAVRGQWSDEFHYFKHPQHKLNALLSIISQPPLEIDLVFASLPDEETKIAFLQRLLPTFNRENQNVIRQLIFDVRRDILIKSSRSRNNEIPKTQFTITDELLRTTDEKYDWNYATWIANGCTYPCPPIKP